MKARILSTLLALVLLLSVAFVGCQKEYETFDADSSSSSKKKGETTASTDTEFDTSPDTKHDTESSTPGNGLLTVHPTLPSDFYEIVPTIFYSRVEVLPFFSTPNGSSPIAEISVGRCGQIKAIATNENCYLVQYENGYGYVPRDLFAWSANDITFTYIERFSFVVAENSSLTLWAAPAESQYVDHLTITHTSTINSPVVSVAESGDGLYYEVTYKGKTYYALYEDFFRYMDMVKK